MKRILLIALSLAIPAASHAMRFHAAPPLLYPGGGVVPDADAVTQGVVTTWQTHVIPAPPRPSPEKATFASWRPAPDATNLLEYRGN